VPDLPYSSDVAFYEIKMYNPKKLYLDELMALCNMLTKQVVFNHRASFLAFLQLATGMSAVNLWEHTINNTPFVIDRIIPLLAFDRHTNPFFLNKLESFEGWNSIFQIPSFLELAHSDPRYHLDSRHDAIVIELEFQG
jgi:hypothetical protein